MFAGQDYLRDAGAGVSAKFDVVAAGLQHSRERRGWNRDLSGQRGRMEIDIAQQLVTPESAVGAQNFTARADQISNPLSLIANLQWTSRETGQKKKLTGRIEAHSRGLD